MNFFSEVLDKSKGGHKEIQHNAELEQNEKHKSIPELINEVAHSIPSQD